MKLSGIRKKRVSPLFKVKGYPLNAFINFAALRKTFVSQIDRSSTIYSQVLSPEKNKEVSDKQDPTLLI